ncbi:Thermolabile hemolysin [Zancudomyces culisetae]|uniref:Thermolabile hemolysin n=1 Tax=Zancudomyces culisetae TaxID=1213189 RepID=A0A1R1PI24_ZANCU|nr:Thermolabile hemolysin [Zancudomyces culisetae]|eukprot:OMH80606.1 Thermolabile hemolysin [Zancudomyces culisetae]
MSLKSIERLVVFGDCMADSGNIYELSENTFPSIPFYNGRFSNGPSWVENFARILGVSVDNYAYGGATINNELVSGKVKLPDGSKKLIPGVKQQIMKYLKLYPLSSKNVPIDRTLFIINAGTIDLSTLIIPEYYSIKGQISASRFVTELIECTSMLYEHAHAKNILIVNCFPHELMPYVVQMQNTKITQSCRNFTREFNEQLMNSIQKLSFEYPMLNIIMYNVCDLVKKVNKNPAKYGLDEDVLVPAVDSYSKQMGIKTGGVGVMVENKGAMVKLWFDDSHFGSRMHQIIAVDAIKKLSLDIINNPTNYYHV